MNHVDSQGKEQVRDVLERILHRTPNWHTTFLQSETTVLFSYLFNDFNYSREKSHFGACVFFTVL